MYEIHNSKNIGSSYCFSVNELDSEVFHILRKTAVHRGMEFFDEMDRHNQRIEYEARKQVMDVIDQKTNELKRMIGRSYSI